MSDGQVVIYWETGYYCDCGLLYEPCGFNQMPPELRLKFLNLHGVWQLDVGSNPPNREAMLKILLKQKRLFGFETLKQFPPISGLLAKGTFLEMKILEFQLAANEISSIVSKLEQSQ